MASDGFRIAGAYVTVNLQDNTEADEQRMRARLEGGGPVKLDTALNDPANLQIVKDKIQAGPAATIRAYVSVDDTALAKAQADAEKAGSDAGDAFTRGASEKIREDKTTESAAQQVAARAQSQFKALQFAAMFAGLPAAAAVAGAGVAVGLAGVPAVFTGIAAASLKSDAQVSAAWSSTMSELKSDAQGWAAPFADEFVAAAGKVSAAAQQMSPEIEAASQASAGAVGILTDSVVGLAENAMPGLVVAAQASRAPLLGVQSAAEQAGYGLTDMFVSLSTGAQSSEGILSTLGGTVADAERFIGTLVANVAKNGGPALQNFRGDLQQVEDTLLTLTSTGSVVYPFFSGFTTSVGGMLAVAREAATVLSTLPQPVGQFAGSLVATASIASRFGVDVGAAFDGLTKKVKDAGSVGAGLKEGFSALVEGAFNPVTLAISGVAVGLDVLGQHEQDVAAKTSAHADRVRDLSSALAQSAGAIDDNVRATAQQALEQFNAGDGTRNLLRDVSNLAGPSGIQLLTSGYLGNTQALNNLKSQLQATIDGHRQEANALGLVEAPFNDHIRVVNGVAMSYDDTGFAAQQLLDIINQESGTYSQASQYADNLAIANGSVVTSSANVSREAQAAATGANQLRSAFGTLADSASTADARTTALLAVLDRLTGRTPSHEEAIQELNDTIRNISDTLVTGANHADGWGQSLINADGTVNTVTKNGSALQDQMVNLEKGFADAATSVNDLVASGESYDAASAQVRGELQQQRDAFVKLAEQFGLTAEQANKLADTYGLFPGKVLTEVESPGLDTALQGFEMLKGKILDVPNDHTVHTSALTDDTVRKLTALGLQVQTLPDGTVNVSGNTDAAKTALSVLLAQTDSSTATTTVFGNTAPALGAVQNWRNVTQSTTATTTTYSYTDPATQAVTSWVFDTNSKQALTTTFSNTNPAYGAVGTWKRDADSTTGWVTVNANTGPARSSLNDFYKSITSVTVPVKTSGPPLPLGGGAIGGIVKPFASGGFFPNLTPMNSIASVVPPATYRVIGDNLRVPEAYIPLDPQSQRSQAILEQTNAVMGRSGGSGAGLDYSAIATVVAAAVAQAVPAAVAAATSGVFSEGLRVSMDANSIEKGLITLAKRRALR